jgi:pyrimidine operon attenuation protein/uracil phosphoribosyltransferase
MRTAKVTFVAYKPDRRDVGARYPIDAWFHAGPYFSTGSRRESSWSAMLRAAKDPARREGGWDALRQVCERGVADVRRRNSLLARVDVVVSVPPRLCRLRRRGMSLPDELGHALHHSLGIRYEPDALISTVDDIEVKRIPVESRHQIVTGTFAVGTRKFNGQSVLLIDDIMTSGATVAECADQLRNAGVTAVFVYTLGRTADILLCSAGLGCQKTQVHKVGVTDPPREFMRRAGDF